MADMREVYISVDVEASGPVPGAYSMLSLGACVVGNRSQTFYVELRPISSAAKPDAMRVVGKALDHFERDGRDPKEAMEAFRSWIGSVAGAATPVFVGFNAVFDWSFVNWYCHTYLGMNPFGIGGIDIKSFYMGMSGCSWEGTRSSRLPAAYRAAGAHTHNALADAIEQAEIFELMRANGHSPGA